MIDLAACADDADPGKDALELPAPIACLESARNAMHMARFIWTVTQTGPHILPQNAIGGEKQARLRCRRNGPIEQGVHTMPAQSVGPRESQPPH